MEATVCAFEDFANEIECDTLYVDEVQDLNASFILGIQKIK